MVIASSCCFAVNFCVEVESRLHYLYGLTISFCILVESGYAEI